MISPTMPVEHMAAGAPVACVAIAPGRADSLARDADGVSLMVENLHWDLPADPICRGDPGRCGVVVVQVPGRISGEPPLNAEGCNPPPQPDRHVANG